MAFRAFAPIHSNSTNQLNAISGQIPAACVAGDTVLICAVQSTGTFTQSIASSGPTTPTLLHGPDSINSNVTAYLWAVTLAAGDVGATITVNASSAAYFVGAMIAFSGRSGAAVVGESTASATTSLTSPTVTTTADMSDVACFYVARSATAASPTITPPSTQTKAGESYTANSASPNFDICAAYRTTPGAAGTYGGGAATCSQTATGAVLYTVGLAPLSTTSSGLMVYGVNADGTTSRYSVYYVDTAGALQKVADKAD